MEKKITVMAPASVANVSCGYDIMGFALEDIGDEVTLCLLEGEKEIKQVILTGRYGHLIPSDLDRNTASVAVEAFLRFLKREDISYQLELKKNLPLGSGLGSSASSAVAAVVAMNTLLGGPLAKGELLPFAMEGERIACGAAHADNVAPSLLGGFTLIRSYDPLDVVSIPCPENLFAVVVYPDVELKTADARRILRTEIDLKEAVSQSANAAGFVSGLLLNNRDLISRSMEDLLAEPKRMQLIPGFQDVKKVVMDAGAIGFGISGSGPSVFALCDGNGQAKRIGEIMKNTFKEMGLEAEIYCSSLNAAGAKVVTNDN